jgi:hypothetical protein
VSSLSRRRRSREQKPAEA